MTRWRAPWPATFFYGAAGAYTRAVDIAAETARAWEAFATGRHAEAADGAKRVLRQVPKDPGALTLVARVALSAGEPAAAHDILRGLLDRFPDMTALWLDLAVALRDLGGHAEALKALQNATELDPRNASAWIRLGEVRLNFGERTPAADAFRRALEVEPDSPSALRGLALAGAIEPGSGLAGRMDQLARSPRLGAKDAAGLHYALAQMSRNWGLRARFIHHVFEANALQRSLAPAVRSDYEAQFDRLEAAFTPAAFSVAARAEPTAPRPIFILGMPRSGTTLLERLLAGHPKVRAGGELDYMRGPLRRGVERLTGKQFPFGFESIPAAELTTLAQAFARRLEIIGGQSSFVTDKTPGNFHLLGLLRLLFPDGRIVHVARDALDTCFSILQFQFDDRSPHTCDMELLAYAYARYLRLMQRWRDLFADEFITVRYEEFVASPLAEGRRIFEHCGLEWSDDYLAIEQAGGAVRTFSALQVRRPIYRTSVGAWREFEAELAPLRRALESEGVPT